LLPRSTRCSPPSRPRAAPSSAIDSCLRIEIEGYRGQLAHILRAELDNILAFQEVLGADPEMVVVRGAAAADEDTFTLAPDLHWQLTRKREIMLARWQDVARVYPMAERSS
jgi:hypothetical protein